MCRPVWCRAYLIALKACDGNVSKAADFTRISRQIVYLRRAADESFAEEERRIIDAAQHVQEERRVREIRSVFGGA